MTVVWTFGTGLAVAFASFVLSFLFSLKTRIDDLERRGRNPEDTQTDKETEGSLPDA